MRFLQSDDCLAIELLLLLYGCINLCGTFTVVKEERLLFAECFCMLLKTWDASVRVAATSLSMLAPET